MIRAAILYHVYSGHLFFTAAALFVIGAFIPRLRLLTMLAIPLAAFSGTPVPIPILALLVLGIGAYFAAPKRRSTKAAALLAVGVAVVFELPYHVARPHVPRPGRLFVIGDSLAAGGFGERAPWPIRLGATNLARPADIAVSARDQLAFLPPPMPDDCVIVEIGGNDMLEGRPVAEFAAALDQIVSGAAPRNVVMLELPLLPGSWRYGAAQRRVARKHGAILVPKRVLAGVLVHPRNTTDGIHLTERGHEELAREMRTVIPSAAEREESGRGKRAPAQIPRRLRGSE